MRTDPQQATAGFPLAREGRWQRRKFLYVHPELSIPLILNLLKDEYAPQTRPFANRPAFAYNDGSIRSRRRPAVGCPQCANSAEG